MSEDWTKVEHPDLFGATDPRARTRALNDLDRADADRDARIAARVDRLREHPTVRAHAAATERVTAARAEAAQAEAARAERDAALPPPLESCQVGDSVQHRVRGWVGKVSSVDERARWVFVKVKRHPSSFSAWFAFTALCAPPLDDEPVPG